MPEVIPGPTVKDSFLSSSLFCFSWLDSFRERERGKGFRPGETCIYDSPYGNEHPAIDAVSTSPSLPSETILDTLKR